MKKITSALIAAVAAIGLSSSALAADLIIDEPIDEGFVDVSGTWDGPYIGIFGGWGWGEADHTNGDVGPCAPDGCDVLLGGGLLGLVAGVNFTVTDGIVAGIAGDVAWTNISGTEDFGIPIGDSSHNVNFEGSVRGVLGFDGGMFMPYLTAGLAVANASHFSDFAGNTATATHIGGTVGVGVAVAVAENISLDFQYRHTWYDEQEYDHGNAPFNPVFALQTDRVTAGINLSF